uniref:Sulfhydryl oxidase n=2 Tax=Trichuris muris TaxID=70415 RepID=A0A5S6R538_TRIMR
MHLPAAVHAEAIPTPIPPVEEGLYSVEDSIALLNDYNFNSTICAQTTIWFILFYSQFCGHCVNFAPTWKQLAASTDAWSPTVRIAAVNCANKQSQRTCRMNKIWKYPEIIAYPPYSKNKCGGQSMHLHQEVPTLRSMMANATSFYYNELHPSTWPNFDYISRNETAASIFEEKKENKYLVIVFQEPYTPEAIGEQLILYYAKFDDQVSVRLAPLNHSLREEESNVTSSMAIYSRENPAQSIYTSRSALNLEFALEVIKMYCLVGPKNTEVKTRPQLTTNFVAPKEQLTGDDLRSAVMHLLSFEEIYPNAPRVLSKGGFSRQNSTAEIEQMANGAKRTCNIGPMAREDSSAKSGIPTSEGNKVGPCQGSKIYYRGYSCGLWMLFHTVTVEAYLKDGNKTDFEPTSVPETINEYMQHFFSCRECADHFGEAAANISSEVTRPEDVVLWLWKAHNRANGFLRGTPSEDPSHPKVQFPTKDLCQSCYTANGQWEEGGVFEFLTGFYRLGVCN